MGIDIYINGALSKFHHSFSFASSMGTVFTGFSLVVDEVASGSIFLGDVVEMKVLDETIFTGVILEQTEHDSHNVQHTEYRGGNLLSIMLYSDVKPKTYNSKLISSIINESISEIGADGKVTLNLLEDKNVRRKKIPIGKSVLNLITELASDFGMYAWSGEGNNIYIGHPVGGSSTYAYTLDFDKPLLAMDMTVHRSIKDAANSVVMQGRVGGGEASNQGLFKTRKKQGKTDFLELFGVSNPNISFKSFSESDLSSVFDSGAYKVLGSTRPVPSGGVYFDRTKYMKANSDTELTVEDQYRLALEKFYPTFEIKITLEQLIIPQLNTLYKIINKVKNVDGLFLLKGYEIQVNNLGEERTILNFSLPGHL